MYEEIFEQLPFYVRTNMILVDAVDVKKKYTTALEETISFLQKAIHNDVHSNNTRLAKEIVSMQEAIQVKAETTEKLVELE